MSYTMNIEIEMTDIESIKAAAEKLNARCEEGRFKLYQTTEIGTGIFFKHSEHPMVITNHGIKYDEDYTHLKTINNFIANYGVEKAKKEARMKGYNFTETKEPNGDIKLIINYI